MSVANKERGELPLVVGDQTYILKLTTNGICQMETASGRAFDHVVRDMQRGSLSDMRLFVWAMLLPHHPEMTVLQTGDLLDRVGLFGNTLQAQIDRLIALNTEETPKDGGGNPPQAQPGTGANSTSTPAESV